MEEIEKTSINTKAEVDLNNDDANYAAAVKCIFKEPRNIVKGAFCLLLRKHDNKVIETIFWASKSKSDEGVELNVSMQWEEFSTKIPSIGPIDREICVKLQQALKDKLSGDMIEDLFVNHESKIVSFSSEIRGLFEEKLHYMIKLDTEFEPFSRKRLIKTGYEREETNTSTNTKTNTESISMTQIFSEQMESQIINCTAIVDPVNGIAASDLKTGDLVEIVLPTNNTIGALLSDYYAKLKKIPSYPVKKVSVSENGSYIIELDADGGLTCVIKLTSNLRLRTKKGYINNSSVSGRTFIIIAGFCVALFIILLIVLLMMLME